MANSKMTYKEIRFKIGDELTECFIFVECLDFHLAHGWFTKTFPPSMSCVDILNSLIKDDCVLWDKGAP